MATTKNQPCEPCRLYTSISVVIGYYKTSTLTQLYVPGKGRIRLSLGWTERETSKAGKKIANRRIL